MPAISPSLLIILPTGSLTLFAVEGDYSGNDEDVIKCQKAAALTQLEHFSVGRKEHV